MEAILKCVISVLIFFVAAGYIDADCNLSCLAMGNETEPLCNTTTQKCLHGCIEGFAGEKCQFKCSSNCSDCTVNECTENCNNTCDIDLCYENHTCTQGCLDGLYGQNCSIPCTQNCRNSTCHRENGTCTQGCLVGLHGQNCSVPCPQNCRNSTCHRENGTCTFGCDDGFYGDDCQKSISDADCSFSCEASPVNEPPCNETTKICLYGCQEGYIGEQCEFKCMHNCSNCSVEVCQDTCTGSCDNTTCLQNETCIEGCRRGLHGQNCSLPCPTNCKNETCHRENGTCTLGCDDGFYGDMCENLCDSLCNETHHVKAATCDDKTLECKYTCQQGFGGDHCQYDCDYNCLTCGSELIEADKVECDLCKPDYHYFNERCEECNRCSKDPNSTESSCDQVDGTCKFGCIGNHCSPTCQSECSNFCINKTCGFDCCCTEGCKYDVLGGCRCDAPCPKACVGGTCGPDLSCKVCEVNQWGLKCESTCNDHCKDAANTSISVCDRGGNCLFGCENTFWGNTCSTNCSENCLEKDCNANTGHCVQGCIKTYWGDVCENDCRTNCLESDCYRYNATCRLGCINSYYGTNCSDECPENCLNGTCFRENGTCSLGCVGDYTGHKCEDRKIPPTEPPISNVLFVGITAGGSGGGLIALIIAALIVRNRYVAYRESVYMKDQNRKTKLVQKDLKKEREEAFGIINRGFLEGLKQRNSDTESDQDTKGVLPVGGLMDHLLTTTADGYLQEFQELPKNVQSPSKKKRKGASYKANKGRVRFDEGILMTPVEPGHVDKVIIENEANEDIERSYNASQIQRDNCKSKLDMMDDKTKHEISGTIGASTNNSSVTGTTAYIRGTISQQKHSTSIRYWPEKDKTEIYENISVTNMKEETFANFVCRELSVKKNDETRTVRQLQLSLWPDAKKEPNIADMINFYVYYRSISDDESQPPLIHCSDGEGRTGVFIAMDILVKEGEIIRVINILDCVKTLREQRDNMVQTVEQYQFLYKLVVHILQTQSEPVSETDYVRKYEHKLKKTEINPAITYIHDSFENLRAAVVMKPIDAESVKRQWNLKNKNREEADIPEDQYRPPLPGAAYINAVYMDTLQKKGMIVTQMPLQDTVADFYKLIAAEKCSVIVMLNTLEKIDKTTGVYWPMKGSTFKHGKMNVKLEETVQTQDFKQMKLNFHDNAQKDYDQPISLYQFTSWETGKFRPTDTSSMLRLIQAVQAEQNDNAGPVVVHCLNGSERSGVFCALYELTDSINKGYKFSVPSVCYKIKIRRPSAILNLDQFNFIHEAIETYITSQEFRGEPVQTAEIPFELIPDEED